MKPSHRQDSQQHKDVLAARSRMEAWPTRHPRATASPACALTRARTMPSDKVKASLLLLAALEPSFVTYRRRTASVEDGTLSCNLRQQAGA